MTVTVNAESAVLSNSTSDIGTSSDDLSLSATSTAGEYVWGRAGADMITGNSGADHLFGGSGNDILDGKDDADVIFGGAGDDKITGGFGADILTGGTGTDIFIWNSADKGPAGSPTVDHITDFTKSSDVIDICDLLDTNGESSTELLKHLSVTDDASGITISIHTGKDSTVTNDITNKIVLDNIHYGDVGATSASEILTALGQHLLIDKT